MVMIPKGFSLAMLQPLLERSCALDEMEVGYNDELACASLIYSSTGLRGRRIRNPLGVVTVHGMLRHSRSVTQPS